jgi:hypothetical protein
MTINLTLFAQIFHFLLAYWMLRRWFFTPIFAIIEAQDSQTAKAEQKLAQQRLHNEVKEQELIAEQQAIKSFFNANKPLISEEKEQQVQMPELHVPELTASEQAETKRKLAELFVRKVERST